MSRTCPECQNTYDDEVLHCPEDGLSLAEVPAVDDLIGRTIGSYEVTRVLGKGGMGAVYLGQHPVIGSRVAIKFLHPQYSSDEKIVERFFNEARAVNVIGHDNILKILDLNVTEDHRHYFVMEYLNGRPLQSLIKGGAAVPLHMAGPILLQVCDALQAAHDKGIVHRDLKPDNVYLIAMKGKKNFVKVVDFGIARVTDEGGLSTGKTQTGMVMGTPAYMSPEQGSGATDKIDGRSDVYSLGVMMFQLAAGRLPFQGSNFGEVLMGHLQQEPPRPRSINPSIPPEYEAIILKCLQKRQEDRFQSMRELHDVLEVCLEHLRISRDLPAADGTETDDAFADARPGSTPGRTPSHPGRSTPSGGRLASRPAMRSSNPALRTSQPQRSSAPVRTTPRPGKTAPADEATRIQGRLQSRPRVQQGPQRQSRGRTLLLATIGAVVAVAAVAVVVVVKQANSRAEELAAEAKQAAETARRLAAEREAVAKARVTLSVNVDPIGATVVATWAGGEKRGTAPLEFVVPHNARVHFELTKEGFLPSTLDVDAEKAQAVSAALRPVPQAASPVPTQTTEKKPKPPSHRDDSKRKKAPASSDGLMDVPL